MKDQMVYQFDVENRLISVTDRNGNETRHVYNDAGQLTKIIDPVDLETTFGYTDNRVTTITDPTGRETTLEYDDKGNLERITDPDESRRTWEYDDAHHMRAETDKRGNREQTFYDFAGRADIAILKDGAEIDFDPVQVQGLYRPEETIDPLNAPVASQLSDAPESTYVDANGNTITYVLDQAGQTVSVSDEEGELPTVQRNENNLVERSTNARGNVTAFEYDENGNVLSIADEFSISSTLVSTSGGKIGTINNLSGEFTSLATALFYRILLLQIQDKYFWN